MKKKVLVLVLSIFTIIKAQQDADLFVELHNVPSTDIPTNITNATSGDLLYNSTDQNVYVYDGSIWKRVSIDDSSDLTLDMTTGILTLTNPSTTGNEVDLHSYVRIAPVKEITGDYTLVEADTGHVLDVNSTSLVTITVPSTLPKGFNVSAYQTNTGGVTFVAAAGASLYNRYNSFTINGQHAGIGIVCLASTEFHFTGNLKK